MEEVKKKHAGGRPPKEIDFDKVEQMAAQGCTQEDIAGELGVAYSTLKSREEFSARHKKGADCLRNSLRSRAVAMAEQGDKTMLIFLLKNFCGMRDVWDVKQEVSGSLDVSVLKKIADEALKALPDDTTPAH